MTVTKKHRYILGVADEDENQLELEVKGGRITLDQGQSPHIQGDLTVKVPDTATYNALEPRKFTGCVLFVTDDRPGPILRAFTLSLRGREFGQEDDEVVLSVASYEALLLDYKPLADDYTPLGLASSLRDIVNYVLETACPSIIVTPWHLQPTPANDADMTPIWSVTFGPGNSGFDGGLTAGYAAGVNVGALVITNAAGYFTSPPNALRYQIGAAGGNARLDIGLSNKAFPVTPGRTYTVAIQHRSSIARSAVLGVRWVNADGDTIGSAMHNFTSSATQMERHRLTTQAPAGAAFIWPYIITIGNLASQFHYLDDVMIVESEFLPDYFDGNTPDTATYDYSWAGAANASQKIRTALVDGVTPDALVWRAGVSALDFLLPLIQTAGLRLVHDGLAWTLRDEDYTAAGSTSIGYGVNLIDGSDVIDRESDLWCDAQVTRYTWTDLDGIQRQAVDAYADDPDYTLARLEEFDAAYPGPGYSEYCVRRAQQRGREVTATAQANWAATAEQPVTITLNGAPAQSGVIQSVEFDLEADQMTVTTRSVEEL